MDNRSKTKIAKQYDELVEKHGFDMRSLHDKDASYKKAHQNFKFQFVMDQLTEKDSLLDVDLDTWLITAVCVVGKVVIQG